MIEVIELGASGAGVRAWQRIFGIRYPHVDGDFGPGTDAACKVWQLARGVEADGVIGPLTRACLTPADFIKPHESCVLQAYDDDQTTRLPARLLHREGDQWIRADGFVCKRYPTIGWGKRLGHGEWIERCTQAQADAWYLTDIRTVRMPFVREVLPVPEGAEPDAAKDCALASFCYNGGPGAIRALRDHAFDRVWWVSHWITSAGVYEPGLKDRREEEAALYYGTAA